MSGAVPRLPSGIIPILATAFDSSGGLDESSFVRQVGACIDDGAAAVAMFGLASEYYKLSDSERDRLARLTVEAARQRVPVILSVTPHARELAVEEALRFQALGASALMVMPPFFLGPSEHAIIAHVAAIADAVRIPVIVQYAPLQTGRSIDPKVFVQLSSEHPNMVGVKVDMVPTGPYLAALAGLSTYVGYLGLHLPEAVERGASGCMPSASLTPAFVRCWDELLKVNEQGRKTHGALLPGLNFMMQSVEFLIACEKRLLVARGVFESACPRAPYVTLDDVQARELDRLAEVMR
jgi:dihydrodipicolinate synthase/N-acetylneuraminate lyase